MCRKVFDSRPRIADNAPVMAFRRFRTAVLLVAMLFASVAPTLAVSLHGETAAMGCCAAGEDTHCRQAALQRACCPCGPAAPAGPPASASAAQVAPLMVVQASWAALPPARPGAIAPSSARALARLLAQAPHDPSWLLNAAILI